MPNLRIIHDNAADRATVTASSTAGTLVAANMLTDLKGQVHRSIGTSVTYTLTWASFETVSSVALPACNLTADATIRVRGYDALEGGTLVVDSGTQYACPGQTLGLWDWAGPLNGNAFAYGGTAKAVCWLADHYAVKRLVIDIQDAGNPAGYIDCARLVLGGYWSPAYNASYGASINVQDASTNTRNDSGDLLTDRAALSETLEIKLELMPPADRARINQIMRSSGTFRPVLVALIPDDTDPLLQQDSMIYGKRQNADITFDYFNAFGTSITVEGW